MTNRRHLSAVAISLTMTLLAPFLVFAAEEFQPVYQVFEELDVRVPMRDGVMLSANIYRPDDPGRFPVLLMRSPYGNGGKDHKAGHFWAQQGYAVVIQDTRGRYESEGVFDPCRDEAADGYDTQQWAGAQPWCNGKIGTFGGSYVGITQWLPAPLGSPYLVCMMPAVATADVYNLTYPGGAFRLRLWTSWCFAMTAPYAFDLGELNGRLDEVNRSLPLMAQDRQAGWRVSFLRDWLAHPEKDVFWEKSSIKGNYAGIRASVYGIGGWYDFLLEGTLAGFTGMTAPDIDPKVRAGQKLLVGPWNHGAGRRKAGSFDFGEIAKVSTRDLERRWFDSQLKGLDNGMMDEPPVRIFVMGVNQWRNEQEWPLARTRYTKYYFHSKGRANTRHGDGALSTRLPVEEPADIFAYDPENPVPSRADSASFNPFAIGPHDQRPIQDRADVLVYTTPPLKADLEATGPVEVLLYAASSAENTDFTAKLVDVYPDGRAMNLCEGILRASHRNGPEETSNIEPGKAYEYRINLVATSNVFKRGHRVCVEISSSNFPRFDRNLNTGRFAATDTTWVVAEQTVYHSKAYPSCIVLPVIE